jgi:cytochrome b561
MKWRNTGGGYGSVAIALHWLMLVLLVGVVALMELRGYFPKGSVPREAMKHWHYVFGLVVLVLAVLRVANRFAGPSPAIVPAPPGWQSALATVVALGLYALMLGMPLVGWMALSANGDPIPFFGWQLVPLVGVDAGLAEVLEELHEAGATAAYVLVGLHVAAALYHHYLVRDNTLQRIVPWRLRGSAQGGSHQGSSSDSSTADGNGLENK